MHILYTISPTAIGLQPPSPFISGVSRVEHSMGWPGAVAAAMKPVRIWSALRMMGERRAMGVVGQARDPWGSVRLQRLESNE